MSNLSVVILTKNEENNILDCLESVKDAGEIIVVDDYSEDRTLEIVKKFDNEIRILKRAVDKDFSAQRNFGLSKATNEWVLFVDADERVSTLLREEIKQKTANNKIREINGYYIKRRDVMWGRELKYGEVGNIKLIRLAKKNAGKWAGQVHETCQVAGKVGDLENELLHFPHRAIRDFLSEISLYSSIRAEELKKAGSQVSVFDIVFYPKVKFFLNYFIKLGFLDGVPGLIVALMMSFHSFLVRSKLWLLQNER